MELVNHITQRGGRQSMGVVCLGLLVALVSCDRREAIEHYNRGVLFAEAEQYLQAIGQFQKALALVDDFSEAHNSIGYVYNQLGRYDEAIKHFVEAAEDETFQQRALAFRNLGTAYANSERYSHAEAALQQAIELEPLASRYVALAQVYALQEKPGRALGALENALRHDPDISSAIWAHPVFEPYMDSPEFLALRRRSRP